LERIQEVDEKRASSASHTAVPRLDRTIRVIELGAGTGVAGIAAAALLRRNDPDDTGSGAAVLLTDVAAAVPGLKHTIELNSHGGVGGAATLPVRAGALDWTRCDADLKALGVTEPFDVVIAADVVWVAHLIKPFVSALLRVTRAGSVVVFGYQSRSSAADKELFGLLQPHFDVTTVDDSELDPVFRATGTVTVYLLVRRQSLSDTHDVHAEL
jgi:predicted nicotinamide N-methyase